MSRHRERTDEDRARDRARWASMTPEQRQRRMQQQRAYVESLPLEKRRERHRRYRDALTPERKAELDQRHKLRRLARQEAALRGVEAQAVLAEWGG